MTTEFNDPNCHVITLVDASGAELEQFEQVRIAPPVELGYTLKVDGTKYEVVAADGLRWTVKPVAAPAPQAEQKAPNALGALTDEDPIAQPATTEQINAMGALVA